uniref:Uncharacterized protein n=1 Tax=Brassica oleracea TaxID=3712 RepID=A0A3P6FFP3_BRAOL|nr:unnamed protein product [Brassica oleracea]
MYRSRCSCSSSKVAPSNCAESDTTVPDSPARAEKFAERYIMCLIFECYLISTCNMHIPFHWKQPNSDYARSASQVSVLNRCKN